MRPIQRARKRRRRYVRLRRRKVAAPAASPPTVPLEWLFRAPQVVSPRDDSFAQMRARIAEIAESRNEWAGMPTLMDDLSFHIEPSYPYADAFAEDEIRDDDEALTGKLRNMFWSWRLRMWIFVYEKDGKITFGTSHN